MFMNLHERIFVLFSRTISIKYVISNYERASLFIFIQENINRLPNSSLIVKVNIFCENQKI